MAKLNIPGAASGGGEGKRKLIVPGGGDGGARPARLAADVPGEAEAFNEGEDSGGGDDFIIREEADGAPVVAPMVAPGGGGEAADVGGAEEVEEAVAEAEDERPVRIASMVPPGAEVAGEAATGGMEGYVAGGGVEASEVGAPPPPLAYAAQERVQGLGAGYRAGETAPEVAPPVARPARSVPSWALVFIGMLLGMLVMIVLVKFSPLGELLLEPTVFVEEFGY